MWEQREPFYVHHRTKVVTDVALRRSEPFQQQIEIKQHFCFPRYPPTPPKKPSVVTRIHHVALVTLL